MIGSALAAILAAKAFLAAGSSGSHARPAAVHAALSPIGGSVPIESRIGGRAIALEHARSAGSAPGSSSAHAIGHHATG